MAVGDPAVAEIALSIAAGQADSENSLVRRFYGPIFRFLVERCRRDEALAADLTQATFEALIKNLRRGKLQDPAKLPGYAYAIARQTLQAHLRKAETRLTRPDTEVASGEVDYRPGPEGATLHTQAAELVSALLDELRIPRDRELLHRYFLLEHDKSDICQALELGSAQFDRVLYRAKQRLRELAVAAGVTSGQWGAGDG